MKLRESGMPEEAYWETLFDVPVILDGLRINRDLRDVVELGGGYGTSTLPVAQRISGLLTTFDIEPAMVERTRQRAAQAGVSNVVYVVDDVFAHGFGGKPASKDACLLFNILHCEQPVRLLAEAARVLRPSGLVHVIHWRYDPATPRGPSVEIRPRPERIIEWARRAGLSAFGPVVALPPWHYGILFRREAKDQGLLHLERAHAWPSMMRTVSRVRRFWRAVLRGWVRTESSSNFWRRPESFGDGGMGISSAESA